MKKILANIFLGFAALGFAAAASAATDAEKAAYKETRDSATATYKAARTQCDTLKDNPKDVCIAEAKAAEKRSKAKAEAKYKNTPKARMNALIAGFDADYDVAKEKCDAQSGNTKDVCLKEAKAVHTKAVADAKASKEIGEVKSDAKEDRSDANYEVAIEKCDAMSGPAKEACVASAKSKYDK